MKFIIFKLYPVCLFITYSFSGNLCAQDILVSEDSTVIEGKINKIDKEIIRFIRTDNGEKDSIPTLQLRSIKTGDVTYIIYPASHLLKGKTLLTLPEFLEAFDKREYAKLLHANTVLEDIIFATGQITLPQSARNKLVSLMKVLNRNKELRYGVFVHTDSIGKASANLDISQRRANSLLSLFLANGFTNKNIQVTGRGEEEPLFFDKGQQLLNRRIELRVSGIEKMEVLYAVEYVPPIIEVAEKEADKKDPVLIKEAAQGNSYTINDNYVPVKSKVRGKTSFVISVEGLFAVDALSGRWSSKDGIGILQGFGGEAMFMVHPQKWLGLSIHAGFSQWEVLRRYMTEEKEVVFTTSSVLQRIPVKAGTRIYLGKSFYIHPQGGGHLIQLTVKNSDMHPEGINTIKEKGFKPFYGGSVGFEKKFGTTVFLDFALQYFVTPNTAFGEVYDDLHYGGIRIGLGFR